MNDTYIQYVEATIARYSEAGNLVRNKEVNPTDLNRVLAEFLQTNLTIIAEYQRAKVNKFSVENEYNIWYDQKFMDTRKSLFGENETNSKISVKEIETQLRVNNKDEYKIWQEKLAEADFKEQFLLRVVEQYKKLDQILVCLSQNLRQEMRTLSIDNRINADPEKNSNNRVRTRFPEEQG